MSEADRVPTLDSRVELHLDSVKGKKRFKTGIGVKAKAGKKTVKSTIIKLVCFLTCMHRLCRNLSALRGVGAVNPNGSGEDEGGDDDSDGGEGGGAVEEKSNACACV